MWRGLRRLDEQELEQALNVLLNDHATVDKLGQAALGTLHEKYVE
jgi:hypothetical protein